MAYNITLTNGQNLVTIVDGTADSSYSSLTLFGKNYAGYGPLLNENMIKALENFSFTSPPPSPLQGQLWWDSNNKLMKVRKDQDWKIISGPTASATSPSSDTVGDLWWDSTNKQLNAFNGIGWTMIGPSYTAGQGVSGPIVSDIPGATDGLTHTVVEFYSNGTVMAVLSKDATFNVNAIPGFAVLKPGFNLPSNGSMYYGNSENALSLGGVLAANFLRSDVSSVTNFPLAVKTNTGFSVGANNDFTIGVSGQEVTLTNNIDGRDSSFYVNSAGVNTLGLKISSLDGKVTVNGNPTATLGVATKGYVDTTLEATASTLLKADGTTAIVGNLSPTSNNLYSLGSPTANFDIIYARKLSGTEVSSGTGSFNSITINDAPTVNTSGANKLYIDSSIGTLSNQVTNTIQSTVSSLVDGAPTTLSTIGKLATSLNNDPTFSTTVNTALNLLAPKDSPDFTGSPQAPTPTVDDISSRIATTSFVAEKLSTALDGVNLISPVITGTAVTDTVQTNGGITTITNSAIDIGSLSNRFRKIYGTSTSAYYADLAEKYVADAEYEPGTVLDFGGDKEVTISTSKVTTSVAGVVSWNPGYLMNELCEGEFTIELALQGRVPVKVTGEIRKGDLLVSAGDGTAMPYKNPPVGTVIGKALEDYNNDEVGIIEVAVGRC